MGGDEVVSLAVVQNLLDVQANAFKNTLQLMVEGFKDDLKDPQYVDLKCLPSAFVENSKPTFLKITTNHSCHTFAMCISFDDTKSQPTIETILTFISHF